MDMFQQTAYNRLARCEDLDDASQPASEENHTKSVSEPLKKPHLPPNHGHGELRLTPEGGWHMVLLKVKKVEIGNSG
jgi:hypothetical protein